MLESWRWFGPDDPVTLENIIQAGASGVVTSLHHIPVGAVWHSEDIATRKAMIAAKGLHWAVVESLPVHNDIKLQRGDYSGLISNYQQSLRNLAAAGINTVCYNFMPVVDWTRTNLMHKLDNESYALSFDMNAFIAYDVFVLQRKGSADCYSQQQLTAAKDCFQQMSETDISTLEANIIAGLPGGADGYNRQGIAQAIADYNDISTEQYRRHLFDFLAAVVPVAEEVGVNMCIHPDDPPFSLFGLPRIVSSADDARALLQAAPSPSNGLTMCAGSFGASADNDLIAIIKEFGSHIHFVHLRNVSRSDDGSFLESEHLDGDNDMYGIIEALLEQEAQRKQSGRGDLHIPMRPDHGHLLADDIGKQVNPGYSMLGRMKGLAELRGAIYAIERMRATRQ